MKWVNFFLLSIVLFSCNEQRSDRVSRGGRSPSTSATSPFSKESQVPSNNSDTSGIEIPSEIRHCQWSQDGLSNFSRNHPHLSISESDPTGGHFNLCQSQTNSKNIYIQVKTPINETQTCFLPTYYTGDKSTFIGEPRCLFLNNNQKIFKVDLIVNRNGYTGHPVQGVIIMKDKSYFYPPPYNQNVLSPDAYIYCHQMLALSDPSYCQVFSQQAHFVNIKF